METLERGVSRKGRRATSLLVRAVCVPQGSPQQRPPQPPLAPPPGAASVPRHGSSTAFHGPCPAPGQRAASHPRGSWMVSSLPEFFPSKFPTPALPLLLCQQEFRSAVVILFSKEYTKLLFLL